MASFFNLPTITFGDPGQGPVERAGASHLIESTKNDVRNLLPITDASADLAKTIAEQMRLLLFNVSQANVAYTRTSKTLNGMNVDLTNKMSIEQLDVDLKNKIERDRQILSRIEAELNKVGSQILTNPGGITKLQGWLIEAQTILRQEMEVANNLKKTQQELATIERTLHDSRQKTSRELTNSSIMPVSNYTILDEFEKELRNNKTNTSLYASWQNFYKDFAEVFIKWPDLKRVSDDKKLFIPEPNPPVNLPPDYLTTPPRNRVAVSSFEQQLAVILNTFWSLNSNELDKLQADCFKKYRPPFGYIQDLPENVFVNSIVRACQRNGEDRLRLMLANGPGGYDDCDSTETAFTNTGGMFQVKISPAGAICGCKFVRPQDDALPPPNPLKRTLGTAYGTIRTAMAMDTGDEYDDYDTANAAEPGEGFFAQPSLYGGGGGKRRRVEGASGNDLYSNLYAGRSSSKRRARSAKAAATAAQKSISADYLNSDGATNTIYKALLGIVRQANWYLNESTNVLPDTLKSLISMASALVDLSSLQCLNSNKIDAPYVSYANLTDLISTYDYNITKSDDANPAFQLSASKTIEVLKAAKDLFDRLKPPENALILPKDMWYTRSPDIVQIYNNCYKQVLSVILGRLTAASLYLNKQTVGSIGVVNQDDSAFFIDPALDGKVVDFKKSLPSLDKKFADFKLDIAGSALLLKLNTYKSIKKNIEATIQQVNTNIARAFEDLNRLLADRSRPRPNLGKNLPLLFKKILETRTFCASYELIKDSSLFNEIYTVNDKNEHVEKGDPVVLFSNMDLNTFASEKFAQSLSSPGCLLHRIAVYSKSPNKDLLEPFQKLYSALIDLRMLPDDNYSWNNQVFEPQVAKINEQIEHLNKQIGELEALTVPALEKRFSTPVIKIDEPIADMFTKYGFRYMLEQEVPVNIYMMGPSGSGKSYNQYGVPGPPERKGIDSVLLALKDVRETYFQDSHHLAFAFPESYLAAARGPIMYNYKLETSDNLEVVIGGSTRFAITRDKLKSAYYDNQLKPMRQQNDLIRRTVNNPESSRAFLVTSIKDSASNTKSLIDSPGFEVIPAENLAFTNPFLQIFYVIVSLVPSMTPLPPVPERHKPHPQETVDAHEKAWVDSAVQLLASKFGMFGLQESHLTQVLNETMPTPNNLNWNEQGIVSCTFDGFVKSAFLAAPLSVPTTGTDLSVIITNGRRNIEVWASHPTSGELELSLLTTSGSWEPTETKNRLSTQQTHNLIFDRQIAYAIAWTWAIYKQIVAGPTAPTQTATQTAAQAAVQAQQQQQQQQQQLDSYSGRLLALIKEIARIYPAPVEALANMKLTLEALFINQFNLWVSDSTSKIQSKTIDQYLSRIKAVPSTVPNEKQVFFEFILAVSDLRIPNLNMTIDRYRFQESIGYEMQFNLKEISPGSYRFYLPPAAAGANYVSPYTTLRANLGSFMKRINEAYAKHNRVFALYNKMENNLEVFNGFLTASDKSKTQVAPKNLFFYILNARKADKYFPFFDINMDVVNANLAAAKPAATVPAATTVPGTATVPGTVPAVLPQPPK